MLCQIHGVLNSFDCTIVYTFMYFLFQEICVNLKNTLWWCICAINIVILIFREGKFNSVGLDIGLEDDVVIGYIVS
jgi:hypothetical protein